MRVYNGTNSQLDLPLSGSQRISIPPRTVSGDVMPSNDFLSLLVSSFDYSEIALIVSGPYEITMCAGVSGSVGFVVQSLEEAIERFAEKKPEETKSVELPKEDEPKVIEPETNPLLDSVEAKDDTEPDTEPIVVNEDENPVTEEVVEVKKAKKSKKGNK